MSGAEIVKAPAGHLTPSPGGALSLGAMTPHDAWRFAEALASANLLPREYRNNPGSVLWAMEYGRALGLDVVTTITTIHVINGKPSQSADLMLSRAREAGHRVRITSERERCVARIVRRDDPEDENVIEWTLDDARTAKLYPGKPDSNWAKYPRAMLRARAIAECVRMACPEVLHGAIYTPEELGARVDADGEPVDAEVQQLRRVQPGEADPWATPAPVVQAAVQDVPPQALTPAGRDYLHEAHAAPDAATVRLIWQDARAEGATPAYLAQIADVGRAKATGQRAPAEPVEAEAVPDAPADEHTAAEAELRQFAADNQLPEIDRDFAQATGLPLAEAGASVIREFLSQLRGTAA